MSEQVQARAADEDAVEAARRRAADADLVVVKAGTNSLTDDDSRLDREKLDKLVDDIMDLRERGKDVLLVSSGSIGAGSGRIGKDGDTIEETQALSTVGQSLLMAQYTESFERYDQKIAQLLLTEHDLDNPERFTNLQNTVRTLLDWGIVPVINENDAVATEEVRIGDNDMLSSSVAIGVDADLLVTLTDVGGVYTGNPKHDDDAERIEAVAQNYDEVQQLITDTAEAKFGGIRTKVERARAAAEHDIPAIIARSTEPSVLEKIATAKPVGTLFVPVNGDSDE
ncbi:glutamate 5-kinase [Halobacterium sp. R2-5]|uniref:glutamate 5-kinase n=1 Tax=Halobacterium sp. R2-5 TaxID=2715751 RepID=UPI00141D943C|nr:glutamate 5-kinase [Halobacterium sp. R2-5]NIB99425.1 glutamate 5-kinase [Halobacterium sp. R2-5]